MKMSCPYCQKKSDFLESPTNGNICSKCGHQVNSRCTDGFRHKYREIIPGFPDEGQRMGELTYQLYREDQIHCGYCGLVTDYEYNNCPSLYRMAYWLLIDKKYRKECQADTTDFIQSINEFMLSNKSEIIEICTVHIFGRKESEKIMEFIAKMSQ